VVGKEEIAVDDGEKGGVFEGDGNEETVESIVAHLQALVELVEALVKLGDVQMRLLETILGQNRLQGAWNQLQFVHMAIVAVTAGMVAIVGVLMGVVLWAVAQSSGWQQGLFLVLMLGVGVSLYRLLERFFWSAGRIQQMFNDWREAEFGEDALEEILKREKAAKNGCLGRLLRK